MMIQITIALLTGIALIPIIALFIGIPIAARFKIRFPSECRLVKMDPVYFPKSVSDIFNTVSDMLRPLGFRTILNIIRQEDLPVRTTTYFRFFVNRAEGNAAVSLITIKDVRGEKQISNAFTEFSSDLSTNIKIRTNNSRTPVIFRDVPEKPIFRFPDEENLGALYDIHRKKVSERIGDADRILPPQGRETDYIRDSLTENLDAQVKIGYLYLDKSAEAYRPTWKGAFLMMWKCLFSAFRIMRINRKLSRASD